MTTIAILCPRSEFTNEQQRRLKRLGNVYYVDEHREYSLSKLISLARHSTILAVEPDIVGGFEKAPHNLRQLMEAIPNITGLALDTSSFSYINQDYCRKRGIVVTNVPYCFTEAIAEHTLAMLLGCAKRIFLTDRRTQKKKYRLEVGRELKSMTIGVIGLGHIGTRIAELCKAIGVNVIAWNRSTKRIKHIKRVTIENLLSRADAVTIHLAGNKETKHFLSKERIAQMKDGMIVVNTAERSLVDEKAIAEALKSGKVDQYCFEGENLNKSPLEGLENAVMFHGFGWFTKEALQRNKKVWVNNIVGMAKKAPINPVDL